MKFITLGSCVGGDCILQNKYRNWSSENYVSYSPIAILLGKNNDVDIPEEILTNEVPSQRKRLVNDFKGDVLDKIKKSTFDFLLVDLSDFRIDYKIIEFENGKRLIVTNRTINEETNNLINFYLKKKLNSNIKSEKIKPFSSLNDDELEKYILLFINTLKKNFGENKIIFFKHKLVNQFIDNEKIEYTPNFRISGNINDRIEKIYNIAKKYIDFIDSPRIVIGDKSCMSPFEFHFSMPYYSYMGDCIEDAINKKQIDFAYMEKRLEVCEKEIHRSYNRIFCNQILNRIKGKLDKNIVLLAKTRQFAEMLRERYNKDIYEFIDYNEYSNMEEIKIKIKNLNKDKNLLFILPEYFKDIHQEGLCTIFSDLGYSVGYDVILTLIQKQLLTSYIGKYEDVYGNSFDLQSKHNISIEGFSNKLKLGTNIFPCRISLKHGGYFEMGNNGRAQNSLFRLYIDSYLKIGDNCNFGIECDIACHSYSKIIIGNYVLMSVHEMIYSNDGHSIFQKEGNSYKCINVTRKPIIIGSHVWIGYRCNILSGTQIGDGSIVGAGSIVNKKFPNNVIIGGIPARIIKKNISWSGDPNIRDLKLDKITFDNYANDTKEE